MLKAKQTKYGCLHQSKHGFEVIIKGLCLKITNFLWKVIGVRKKGFTRSVLFNLRSVVPSASIVVSFTQHIITVFGKIRSDFGPSIKTSCYFESFIHCKPVG